MLFFKKTLVTWETDITLSPFSNGDGNNSVCSVRRPLSKTDFGNVFTIFCPWLRSSQACTWLRAAFIIYYAILLKLFLFRNKSKQLANKVIEMKHPNYHLFMLPFLSSAWEPSSSSNSWGRAATSSINARNTIHQDVCK